MEYQIVASAFRKDFVAEVNRMLADGWEMRGPLIGAPDALCREMVRKPVNADRARIAGQIAEAVEVMSVGNTFCIHGSSGSQFEVKRVK